MTQISTVFAVFFTLNAAFALGAEPNPQKLLIRFKTEPSRESWNQTRSSIGASETAEQFLPITQTHILEIPKGSDVEKIADSIKKDRRVETVEVDQVIHAHLASNDEFLNLQWAVAQNSVIKAEQAWDLTHSARNVLIAVIDSGADLKHEDVVDNLWVNSREIPDNGVDDDGDGYVDDVNGFNFISHTSKPVDDFGHGTMVFGEIGAVGNNNAGIAGIIWDTQIMVLKVLDARGNSNISTAVEAIEYAIGRGAKIINLSWGYSPNGAPSQILENAIKKAQGVGILVVASAGNGFGSAGHNNDEDPALANYPSSYPEDNIISVAATDSNDQLADFSDYGSNTVDLGAPGVSIYTTAPGNNFEYFTGTSAAAPFVTGSAALIWSMNPTLNYAQIKRLILETADPLPSLQGKVLSGGRLNLYRALLSSPAAGGTLLSTTSPLPTPTSNLTSATEESSGSAGGCSLQTIPGGNFHCTTMGMIFALASFYWLRNRQD